MSLINEESLNMLENAAKEVEAKVKKGEIERLPEGFISSESFITGKEINRAVNGEGYNIKKSFTEIMTSKDLGRILVPKIIQQKMIEGAEPTYIASRFFNKISLDSNGDNSAVSYVVPIVGNLTAYEVGEGARYRDDELDITSLTANKLTIDVKKTGLKVMFTQEVLDSLKNWGIIGLNYKKMGQAMGRLKEQKCFKLFSKEGHVSFDNDRRSEEPMLGTTGCGESGEKNDTLTNQDFLDMALTVMTNGYNPTHAIMHPLVWSVFAKNSTVGNGMSFGALGGQNVNSWGTVQGTNGFGGLASTSAGQKFVTDKSQVNMAMPMGVIPLLSREVFFSRETKTFDVYCIDGAEIGVILQKEELTNDSWEDPERDILNFKVKERYGVGVLNGGKSISVARNIKAAPTFPVMPVITVKTI